MPIDKKTFGEGTEPTGRKTGHVKERVSDFLYGNKKNAYTVAEIAEEISHPEDDPDWEVAKPSVNGTVRKLEEDGLVERKLVDGLIYNMWIGPKPEPKEEEDEEETSEE